MTFCQGGMYVTNLSVHILYCSLPLQCSAQLQHKPHPRKPAIYLMLEILWVKQMLYSVNKPDQYGSLIIT